MIELLFGIYAQYKGTTSDLNAIKDIFHDRRGIFIQNLNVFVLKNGVERNSSEINACSLTSLIYSNPVHYTCLIKKEHFVFLDFHEHKSVYT